MAGGSRQEARGGHRPGQTLAGLGHLSRFRSSWYHLNQSVDQPTVTVLTYVCLLEVNTRGEREKKTAQECQAWPPSHVVFRRVYGG